MVYLIVTYLDSPSLASTSRTCHFLHVLSHYILTKTPLWKTKHLSLADNRSTDKKESSVYECLKETQKSTASKITLAVIFATHKSVLGGANSNKSNKSIAAIPSILPKNAIAIGCTCHATASVSNANSASVSNNTSTAASTTLPAVVEGDASETLGTVTFANIPESDIAVFSVPTNSSKSSLSSSSQVSCVPQRSDGTHWKVVVLLVPGNFDQIQITTFVDKIHQTNPGVQIIGGFHADSTSFICKNGVAENVEAMVGLCLGGNVIYSSQVSRACMRLGDITTITGGVAYQGSDDEGDDVEMDDGRVESLNDERDERDEEVGSSFFMNVTRDNGVAGTPGGKLKPSVPAIEVASEAFAKLNMLGSRTIFCGITDDLNKGFSMRHVLGRSGPDNMGLVVSGRVRPGDKMQFFTLDPESSAEDLSGRLDMCRKSVEKTGKEALGSILISCAGRGENLYGEPNVESSIFAKELPGVGLSGFFSGGEIGPAARAALPYDSDFRGKTAIQGFTSVFGVFFVPKYLTPTGKVWEKAIRERSICF
jgi:small ligand-binding sensory domain FIST